MKRIFILSSHPLFSQGVESLLRREAGLDIVGRETDVNKAVERIKELRPDVVILDSGHPALDPTPAVMRILREGVVAKVRWILKADSLEELADNIARLPGNEGKMQASTLKATMEVYNQACREGRDERFHRPADKLVPVSGPPYYILELWPVVHVTAGGPRRDAKTRIINVWGKPIPRLYSAGEMGSWWGSAYYGGLIEGIPSGRIAGRNAAAKTPWE